MSLPALSTNYLYAILIIFCRVGTILMFIPGIGETLIPSRIKLLFSILLTIMLVPIVMAISDMTLPNSPIQMVLNIAMEIIIGSFIGLFLKIIVSAVNILGFIISNVMGLSAATLVDPSQDSQQGTLLGNFFTILTIVLIFAFEIDHDVIKGIIVSYKTFKIGNFGEFNTSYIKSIIMVVGDAWTLGVKMGISFIIIGFLINVGGGILSRLMPQLHIFFLIIPLQTLIGFFLLSIMISSIMIWFIEQYKYYINVLFS